MDNYIGRLLDNRYEILEVIGTGGMAVVYKARCHRLNRLVAIKILKSDFLEDEDFRSRFHAESQAVAMLSHPNIVSVYDVSTSNDIDYIVMELIEGISLKQYMEKKGVLNWKETLHFAMQIAKALEHAHSRGIVHRDIKPHNVMVLKNGSVKVTDFGIARLMSKGNTLTKEALGSVHYISPEQAKGGRVDNRSDIYSLGVVMYEMMSGRPPYDGESPVSVAIQHINGGAVMPSLLNPNIPGGLEQIIMKAMAHEASDRYDTATKMLADMDEFRKDPAMLFDYNTPPLDEVIRLRKPPLVLDPNGNQTTPSGNTGPINKEPPRRRPAGAAPAGGTNPAQPKEPQSGSAQAARRRRQEEEARRSKITTIAIVACSAVAILAIVIFLILLLSGTVGPQGTPQVAVPGLIGQEYTALEEYPGIKIVLLDKVYDQEAAGTIIAQDPLSGLQINEGRTVYVTVSLGPVPEVFTMEDLRDLTEARAKEILHSFELELNIKVENVSHNTVPEGCVVNMDPAIDTVLTRGQDVTLWISTGPEITQGRMPHVVGMQVDDAVDALQDAGFDNYTLVMVDSEEDMNKVLGQSEERNTLVDFSTEITLEVSKGPQEPTEPPTTQEPTEPTDPPVPDYAIDVAIHLKGYALNSECKLKVLRNGEVICEQTVPKGTWQVILKNQTGDGLQQYVITINGQYTWIEEVIFPEGP